MSFVPVFGRGIYVLVLGSSFARRRGVATLPRPTMTDGNCRAYALQKHRPLTLHATIKLPSAAEDPSRPIAGFLYMVNLYRPFDDNFIGLWNKSRTDCSTLSLAHLQKQLTQALPAVLDCTHTQAADLRTSQHWLRTIVWQLSITNGFLSSTSPDSSMTFTYPIEVAKDLVAVTSQLSQRSMEVHGVGLVSSILTTHPLSSSPARMAPN